MPDPLFSVVIPAYNSAPFIRDTLKTVRDQTLRDFEIIIVDDGSRDGTADEAEKFLAENRLAGRCIRQANQKIAAARNTGIRAASGRYIALLDHDDFWYPEKLAKTAAVFEKFPRAGLVSHDANIRRNGKITGVFRSGPAADNMYEALLLGGNRLTPSSTSFLKSAALEIGGFRSDPAFNTAEDYDFWLRMSRVAEFRFIDEVLSEYVAADSGASSKLDYHAKNVENVILDHAAEMTRSGRMTAWKKLLLRKRLSGLHRSIAYRMAVRRDPEAGTYVRKMMSEFPFCLKNIAVSAVWLAKTIIKS